MNKSQRGREFTTVERAWRLKPNQKPNTVLNRTRFFIHIAPILFEQREEQLHGPRLQGVLGVRGHVRVELLRVRLPHLCGRMMSGYGRIRADAPSGEGQRTGTGNRPRQKHTLQMGLTAAGDRIPSRFLSGLYHIISLAHLKLLVGEREVRLHEHRDELRPPLDAERPGNLRRRLPPQLPRRGLALRVFVRGRPGEPGGGVWVEAVGRAFEAALEEDEPAERWGAEPRMRLSADISGVCLRQRCSL